MIKIVCDECHSDFEEMDEYTSSQSVAIKMIITSGRRGHSAVPEIRHFGDISCARSWLAKFGEANPELVRKKKDGGY